MRGSSRGSAKAAQAALDAALAADAAWETLAEELFAVTGVVDGNASLRRALADPSRDGSDKAGLARALLGGKVGATTTGLVADVAAQRWSAERDLGRHPRDAGRPGPARPRPSASGASTGSRTSCSASSGSSPATPHCATRSPSRNTDGSGKADARARLLEGKAAPETIRLARAGGARARAGRRLDQVARGLPRARGAASRPAHRARHRRRSAHRAAAAPGCAARSRRTTARPSSSRSSRTPRSWAASGSRSATRSSTAPSCAASTRPAGTYRRLTGIPDRRGDHRPTAHPHHRPQTSAPAGAG